MGSTMPKSPVSNAWGARGAVALSSSRRSKNVSASLPRTASTVTPPSGVCTVYHSTCWPFSHCATCLLAQARERTPPSRPVWSRVRTRVRQQRACPPAAVVTLQLCVRSPCPVSSRSRSLAAPTSGPVGLLAPRTHSPPTAHARSAPSRPSQTLTVRSFDRTVRSAARR